MELLTSTISEYAVYDWNNLLDYWVFIASLTFLAAELLRLLIKKSLTWNIIGDGITNFLTTGAFYALYYVALGSTYVAIYYYFFDNFRINTIPTTLWSIAICVVLADFVYYWEHRFTHKVAIAFPSAFRIHSPTTRYAFSWHLEFLPM